MGTSCGLRIEIIVSLKSPTSMATILNRSEARFRKPETMSKTMPTYIMNEKNFEKEIFLLNGQT